MVSKRRQIQKSSDVLPRHDTGTHVSHKRLAWVIVEYAQKSKTFLKKMQIIAKTACIYSMNMLK